MAICVFLKIYYVQALRISSFLGTETKINYIKNVADLEFNSYYHTRCQNPPTLWPQGQICILLLISC
jgi:hypothetical protein